MDEISEIKEEIVEPLKLEEEQVENRDSRQSLRDEKREEVEAER